MACLDVGSKSLREVKAASASLQHNFAVPLGSAKYNNNGSSGGYPGGPLVAPMMAMKQALPSNAIPQQISMSGAAVKKGRGGGGASADNMSVAGKSVMTHASVFYDNKQDFNYHLEPTDAEEFLAAKQREVEIMAIYQKMLKDNNGLTDAKMADTRQIRVMLMNLLKQQFDHSRLLQAFHDNFWVPNYMTNIESVDLPFTFKITSGDVLPDFSPVDASTVDGLSVWGSRENYAQGWNLPVFPRNTGELDNAYVLGVYIANVRNEYDQAIGITLYHKVPNGLREEPMGGRRFVRNGKRYHFIVNPRSTLTDKKLIFKSDYRINNTYAETYPFMTSNPAKLEEAREEHGPPFYAVKVDHPVLKYAVSQLPYRKNWRDPQGRPIKMFEFSSTSGSEDKVLIPKNIYDICQNEVIQEFISPLPIVSLKTINFKAEFIKNSGGSTPVPRDFLSSSDKSAQNGTLDRNSIFSLNIGSSGSAPSSTPVPLCDGNMTFYFAFRDVKESYNLDDDLVKQGLDRGGEDYDIGMLNDVDYDGGDDDDDD